VSVQKGHLEEFFLGPRSFFRRGFCQDNPNGEGGAGFVLEGAINLRAVWAFAQTLLNLFGGPLGGIAVATEVGKDEVFEGRIEFGQEAGRGDIGKVAVPGLNPLFH